MVKHISCACKWKFNSATCNSKQKWNNETCQRECKNYVQNYYGQNPSTCICENGKYLKSITDTSVIAYDEIMYVMDIVSTNMTNTITTNATSTVSINCHNKKVRYESGLYFACVFISNHSTIHFYLSLLHKQIETKTYWHTTNDIKMENNESKNVCIKIRTCYYLSDIIKFENFNSGNILIMQYFDLFHIFHFM